MLVIDAGCPRNSPAEVVHSYLIRDGIALAGVVVRAAGVINFDLVEAEIGRAVAERRKILAA